MSWVEVHACAVWIIHFFQEHPTIIYHKMWLENKTGQVFCFGYIYMEIWSANFTKQAVFKEGQFFYNCSLQRSFNFICSQTLGVHIRGLEQCIPPLRPLLLDFWHNVLSMDSWYGWRTVKRHRSSNCSFAWTKHNNKSMKKDTNALSAFVLHISVPLKHK